MRRFKYTLDSGYMGIEFTEIVEFEDGVTDEEIKEDFEIWYFNNKKEEYIAVEVDENDNEIGESLDVEF